MTTTKTSTTASLLVRLTAFNDWASIYGVVGVGYGKFQTTEYPTYKHDTSDYGFSYGAGLQFNPMENVALDFSYEQSRIRSVDVGTWIAGVGYRF
ncbi:outer membrane protein X [Escherichia coli]|nr:outer membrane protein X [Escherichia coli]